VSIFGGLGLRVRDTKSIIGLMQLLSDMLVAFLLITTHGSVLMCQVRSGCTCTGFGVQGLSCRLTCWWPSYSIQCMAASSCVRWVLGSEGCRV
jgi:hypothetical protein